MFFSALRGKIFLLQKRKNMKRNAKFNWNVWIWSVNGDKLETYDVGSRFAAMYKCLKPKDRPKTKEEIEKWLESEARYYFWAKCEYEMILCGWPKFKNEEKVDVYQQLRLNWDVFVDKFVDFVSA